MKNIRSTACQIVVALALLSVTWADTPEAVPNYFPAQVGNQWHYQFEVPGRPNGMLTTKVAKLEKIDDQPLIRLETIVQGKVIASEHLAVDQKGLFRHRIQGLEAQPPVCIIKFPIVKGTTWETDTKVGPESVTGKTTLDLEEISVPAGKFKTIVITMDMTTSGQKIETKMWYAEKVGMVQQILKIGNGSPITLKLEKFEEAKSAEK